VRFSKRSLEGEILIDHRASPGLGPEMAAWMGVDAGLVAGGQVLEAPVIACAHCQAIVIVNPDRQRERGWCSRCDKYLCDECVGLMRVTLECRSFARRLDRVQEETERGVSPLLLTRL
jgi:hypothetical protein